MAAFDSCRRSGWVRLLVVILCALFIFATIATPPAYAVGETFALFGAAAVLSSAVAALGFKLSNDSDGIATLNKMVSDFAKEAWALNVLVVGNRINGLIDGMNYIKMAVHNGKTYLDERVVAWCQQWLGKNGIYDSSSVSQGFSSLSDFGFTFNASNVTNTSSNDLFSSPPDSSVSRPSISLSSALSSLGVSVLPDHASYWDSYKCCLSWSDDFRELYFSYGMPGGPGSVYFSRRNGSILFNRSGYGGIEVYNSSTRRWSFIGIVSLNLYNPSYDVTGICNFLPVDVMGNDTGLSGTDTIGADYKDKTLDQILDGLKTWAQDWYDAGADSATNTATGALDLPVTVGDQAATANPALNPDVVYNPPFSIPWPGVRSGETSSGAISDGKANADAAETATTDVAENQSVIDSLVNWALNYINPDTGLFSKFPLCVPYDAYLLATSSLGVDAVGSDSIFGASPGDLDGVVSQDIETYSDFQPIINIKHDFELDGTTYPLELTIDLTPWQPLVTFFREGMALLLVAELIGAEFKRIRGH